LSQCVVKKDRQHNCYTLAYQKNNDTNILPDSFKKTTDISSVSCDDNFAICDAIRKISEIRTTGTGISLPNYNGKSAEKTTKISGFTKLNYLINLVPINYLLVDHLLPHWYSFIKINRSQSMGVH
jgi:hypothetical protein